MTPISMFENTSARLKKEIAYRPFSKEGLEKMEKWLITEKWTEIFDENDAHKKAENLQNLLAQKYHEFFPEKKKVITSDDQPFFNDKLSKLKRQKCREFHKHRRSPKWRKPENEYKHEVVKGK